MISVSKCFLMVQPCQCIRRLTSVKISKGNRSVFQQLRLESTAVGVAEAKNEPDKGKRKRKLKITDSENPPEYLLSYFKTAKQKNILTNFPPNYFQKKQNSAQQQCMYVADESVAEVIARAVAASDDTPIVEVNPGVGILTKKLLKASTQNIHLFEADGNFMRNLDEIVKNNRLRLFLKNEDFLGIWKLTYRDKLDGGNRIQTLLGDTLPKKEWTEGPNAKIVGATGSSNFFKHLVYSIVYQGSLFTFGRCEMFFIVPPSVYIQLTCSKEAGYLLYRYMTVLFQIFFEHEFIERVPRKAFLPWTHAYNHKQHSKLTKVQSIDEDSFYLVRIVPRREVYELCSPDDMQALMFFIKQSMISRRNCVIPMLEKWIPYCGLRLIAQKTEERRTGENPKTTVELPQFVQPCQSISNTDHRGDFNIFTQFGDLTPSQMLSLFQQFRNWPEYKQSPFLALMESNLLKMLATQEDTATVSDFTEKPTKEE